LPRGGGASGRGEAAAGAPAGARRDAPSAARRAGEPQIWALDSASLVRQEDAGQIVLVGSHGGGAPENALKAACRAAIFNDAGIGIDEAGIARLPVLDGRGIAAAAVAAASARIGDGRSSWDTGIISAVNAHAAAAGATSA